MKEDKTTNKDKTDVEICTNCGAYYTQTNRLIQKWKELYHPQKDDVMPQHCYACMG